MKKINFSERELQHYSRHLLLPEIGMNGQTKLKAAKILVVGAGGLGAPLLYYLAAAGVGKIGIVDFDAVDETNLQRQILFSVNDIGKPKVEIAKNRLLELNPHIKIKTYNEKLTSENALKIFKNYDIIADGTDNFPTRYLVNDACVLLGKTNVYGSIFRFEGQVSVFNYSERNGNFGPNYRDLFPAPPPPDSVPNCAEAGVLGVLPGIIGSLQANEIIKIITGIGEPLSGKLLLFNALTLETQILKIQKNKNQLPVKKLIDYENFCNRKPETGNKQPAIKEISVHEFLQWQKNKNDFQLIDVRQKHEYEISNLGGLLIPLDEIEKNVEKISRKKNVVVHCRSGKRSASAIKILQEKYGLKNLFNLSGGILEYQKTVH